MLDQTMQWIFAKILEKAVPTFYGSVTIHFQAGKVQRIETRDTELPPSAC